MIDANFVVSGGNAGCRYDNLRGHQWTTKLASSLSVLGVIHILLYIAWNCANKYLMVTAMGGAVCVQ